VKRAVGPPPWLVVGGWWLVVVIRKQELAGEMEYTSVETIESGVAAGVSYTVNKMSFGRRVELTRRIRELAARREFLEAGDTANEKMEAALLAAEIDRIYLLWGLREVTGLELDGAAATPESLAASGPEELFREALAAVKQQCGLSEAERKN
jgi:hypothetical protein